MRIILCAFDEALQRAWENALRDSSGFAEGRFTLTMLHGIHEGLAV